MRIVMTGASSFTGMWFAEALSKNGHDVTAFLKREQEAYTGIRKTRVERLRKTVTVSYDLSFGSPLFLAALESIESPIDIFCHHASDVTDYRSPDFNYVKALEANTWKLPDVLKALGEKGCQRILLTGSVFERGEGVGTGDLEAISPYGLSKGLTYEAFRFHCRKRGFLLGKFVIPNPFGPYEEDRFTSYLMREWLQGKKPSVKTPDYVRDNVPAPLLAASYAFFAEELATRSKPITFSPSFYKESQGDFALRYAAEIRKRLNIPCELMLAKQSTFDEPLVRINKDSLDKEALHFNEEAFFDENASWYQRLYQKKTLCAQQSS